MRDENISRKIIDSFDAKKEDTVIELGSGQGALTKYLVNKTQNLIAVELDRINCKILQSKFPDLIILKEDILKLDFRKTTGKIRIIGNIPYNITSDILFKLIDNRKIILDAMLMTQEEVARRLTARPGTKEYGITSVFTQVFSNPTLLFKVSRNCFYPKPNVDSRIIKFDFGINLEQKIEDIEFFRVFVRTAFGKRRKMLSNSLKDMSIETKKLNLDFDFKRRAESLSVEEFIELSNEVHRRLGIK